MKHCTDLEALPRSMLQILQKNVPGVGPGLDSIPARSNKVRTSPAGIGWSLVKKVGHKTKFWIVSTSFWLVGGRYLETLQLLGGS